MELVIKETAKDKGAVSKLRRILKIAKNKTVGAVEGINFKKIGQTIILF